MYDFWGTLKAPDCQNCNFSIVTSAISITAEGHKFPPEQFNLTKANDQGTLMLGAIIIFQAVKAAYFIGRNL